MENDHAQYLELRHSKCAAQRPANTLIVRESIQTLVRFTEYI